KREWGCRGLVFGGRSGCPHGSHRESGGRRMMGAGGLFRARVVPVGWAVAVLAGWLAAAASAADRVYWTNEGPVNKISYADLGGTGGADFNAGGAMVNDPEGAALDPSTGQIYWAN